MRLGSRTNSGAAHNRSLFSNVGNKVYDTSSRQMAELESIVASLILNTFISAPTASESESVPVLIARS